jgi:hypothetical protein
MFMPIQIWLDFSLWIRLFVPNSAMDHCCVKMMTVFELEKLSKVVPTSPEESTPTATNQASLGFCAEYAASAQFGIDAGQLVFLFERTFPMN